MGHTFRVEAEYDIEAGIWYVSDSDVPGLATEASSLDELMAKLQVMIPDLFDARAECGLESVRFREGDVPIDFIAHRRAHNAAA
jgi:predicted RNase H-like HicB family nuclease